MQRFYELTYLILPQLEEKEALSLDKEIRSFITQFDGAKIQGELPVTKRKLGLPVNGFESAYLASIDFFFEPKNLKELKRKIEEKKEILRYILFKKRKKEIAPLKEKEETKTPSPSKTPKKVELKDLDKKLEEILEK